MSGTQFSDRKKTIILKRSPRDKELGSNMRSQHPPQGRIWNEKKKNESRISELQRLMFNGHFCRLYQKVMEMVTTSRAMWVIFLRNGINLSSW